ncbi:MAG: hypothetical protein U0325_02195 [Polyangiales bacterium]
MTNTSITSAPRRLVIREEAVRDVAVSDAHRAVGADAHFTMAPNPNRALAPNPGREMH